MEALGCAKLTTRARVEDHQPADQHDQQEQVQPFTPAAFRRAWSNPQLSAESVGAMFGLGLYAAHWRAKALNLPKKKCGKMSKVDPDEFRAMWMAGVSGAELSAHFGFDDSNVARTAKRLGLPGRMKGPRRKMTLAQYRETLLAEAMAETARIEQAQIKLAEMWDKPTPRRSDKRAA